MLHRRTFATLIRARQEARKRLEGIVPPGSRRTGLVLPALDWRPANGTPLDSAAREAVLAEAMAMAKGEARVFGTVATAFNRDGQWRAHPVSGHPTPLRHWSRIRYLEGDAGRDVKEIWELNRHRGLLRLAQAWVLTGDPAWLDHLARHLDAWMAQNPPGMGINWASSLEVGFRAIAWTWIHGLTSGTPLWTATRSAAFAHQLWHHGRHLAAFDSVHHSPNTHLTGEALALVYLGSGYPAWPRASRWVRLGQAILLEELGHQLLEDGFHYERSPGYHRYTVEFYLLWAALLRRSGGVVPDPAARAATAMLEALVAIRRPDGLLPGIGDEDGGVTLPLHVAHPRDPAPVLALGAALLDRPDLARGLSPEAQALAWWVLPPEVQSRLGAQWPEPSAGVRQDLTAAGYHVAGDPAPDGWWCLVDAGPHGGKGTGHTHTDLGHVEIVHARQPLVVDPGSLCYSGDAARRQWDRSEGAHAMLTVEGAPLAEPGGPFQWRRLAPEPEVRVTRESGLFRVSLSYGWTSADGGVFRHERQVVHWPGRGIIVADWVSGVEGRPVAVSWPLGLPAASLRIDGSCLPFPAAGACMAWSGDGFDSLAPRLDAFDFASTYRTPFPAAMLHLTGRGRSVRTVVTWFAAADRPFAAKVTPGSVEVRSGPGEPLVLAPEHH